MGEAAVPINPVQDARTAATATPVDPSASETVQIAQIRSQIEQTRADMSEKIDALQEKLDPARLKEQAKEQLREKAVHAYDSAKQTIRDATVRKAQRFMANVSDTVSDIGGRTGTAMRDTGSSFIDYARENPVPLALVGIGIGMLVFGGRRIAQTAGSQRTYSTSSDGGSQFTPGMTDRGRGIASNVGDTASSAIDSVRDAASNVTDRARDQFNQISDRASEQARVAKEKWNSTLNDNPMALGIAALAAGAILGLSMPSTRIEKEYMGDAREELFNKARSAAHETIDKVQHIAGDAAESVKTVAGLAAKVTQ